MARRDEDPRYHKQPVPASLVLLRSPLARDAEYVKCTEVPYHHSQLAKWYILVLAIRSLGIANESDARFARVKEKKNIQLCDHGRRLT